MKTISPAAALFLALRPRQWVKNGLLFMPILFTLNEFTLNAAHVLGAWGRVLAGFAVFCTLASAIYLVNDICDVGQDRLHPKKRMRPIAAGRVSIPLARNTAVLLIVAGLMGAVQLGMPFAVTAATYVALTLAYSIYLKHIVLIDVLTLSACYVIRAVAGAVVISAWISPWLLVCTTLGSLLVGLAKRRAELTTLENAVGHRKILEEYTVEMLDQMIGIVTASTLMAYMLYTFFSPTGEKHPLLMMTIPFVVYGVFRFLYLMHRHGKGGDPSAELIEDRGLLLCGICWAVVSAAVIYFDR